MPMRRQPVRPILWLAYGLHSEITGIERYILDLLGDLVDRSTKYRDAVEVWVGEDCDWAEDLERLGALVSVQPTQWRLWRSRSNRQIIHNFGRAHFPSSDGLKLLSVWDWGPYRDRAIPYRARVPWVLAQSLGSVQADCIHFLNCELPSTVPRTFRRPEQAIVAGPPTRGVAATGISDLGKATKPLYVGTADVRKRLPALTAFAEGCQVAITLAGRGTEVHQSTHVDALGRVSEERLSGLYRSSSCLLLISDYEGFGLPILEAAIRGIMSVVSPEVYRTIPAELRNYCHVADPWDWSALLAAIRTAESRRGTKFFSLNLAEPLLRWYDEVTKSA